MGRPALSPPVSYPTCGFSCLHWLGGWGTGSGPPPGKVGASSLMPGSSMGENSAWRRSCLEFHLSLYSQPFQQAKSVTIPLKLIGKLSSPGFKGCPAQAGRTTLCTQGQRLPGLSLLFPVSHTYLHAHTHAHTTEPS